MQKHISTYKAKSNQASKVKLHFIDEDFIQDLEDNAKTLVQAFFDDLEDEYDPEERSCIGSNCLSFCMTVISSLKLNIKYDYLDIENKAMMKRIQKSNQFYLEKNLKTFQEIMNMIEKANLLRESIQYNLAGDIDRRISQAFNMKDSYKSSQGENFASYNKKVGKLAKAEAVELECISIVLRNLSRAILKAKGNFEDEFVNLNLRLKNLKKICEIDSFEVNEFDQHLFQVNE